MPELDLASPGGDADESATIRELCGTIERFGRTLDARRIDREHKVGSEILSALADLGLFGLSIPTEYGGFGISMRGICTAVTALARFDRAVATTLGLHLGLGTRPLVAFGTPEQKQAILPELAMGRTIAAFATTEPDAGSDLSAIRTRAVSTGDRLRVNGSKIFVTNGGLAGCLTITASTPGLGGAKRGHSMIVLRSGDPGVRVGAEEEKLGLRGSSTTTLHLDDVNVPLDRVIGVPGQGMSMLHHVLAWGRTVMAAGCVGTATAALEATSTHVGVRHQFGRPLAAFDVVREQVATLAALRFAMEALVRATTTLEDDREALATRSLAAKIFCSEGSWEAADVAVQLHGGSGFIEETGVALLLRDARITRIFEGANDVLRVRLGMAVVGVPAERAALASRAPDGLRFAADIADSLASDVATLTAELRRVYGVRIAQEQRQLHRLGSLETLREATDASIIAAFHHGTPEAADLASHWAAEARRRAAAWLCEPLPKDPIHRITPQATP